MRSPELRRLSGMYIAFAILLYASAGTVSPAAESAVGPLVPPIPIQPERRLALTLGAKLHDLGFTVALRPETAMELPRPRGQAEASWWVKNMVDRAEQDLARALAELKQAAVLSGGVLVHARLGKTAGGLRMDLEFVSAEDGEPVSFSIEAREKTKRPARIVKRPTEPATAPRPSPPPAVQRPKPAAVKQPPQPRPVIVPARPAPRIAIILDDVGEVEGTEAFIGLPIQITFAVMPLRRYSETYATLARAAGKTVILHLPLEPVGGENPGPGAIRAGMSQSEIEAQLEANFRSVPGAVGANNHMGSRGTADEELMWQILWYFKARDLFFVDSNTPRPPSRSAVDKAARSVGVQYAQRKVWLDNDDSYAGVLRQLRALVNRAKEDGSAIGICHANRPNTLAALKAMIPEFERAGVKVVPVTELVNR